MEADPRQTSIYTSELRVARYQNPADHPLWPHLVEEDYIAVLDLTVYFALKEGFFTTDELAEYLENLENRRVGLPPEDEEWNALFVELQEDILHQVNPEGEEPRYLWYTEEIEGETRHALARVLRPQHGPTTSTTVAPLLTRPAASVSLPARAAEAEQLPEPPDATAIALVGLTAIFTERRPELRIGDLVKLVIGGLGVDDAAARTIIGKAVDAGALYRYSSGGRRWYSRTAPPATEQPAVPRSERPNRQERPLNTDEAGVALNVMQLLARPEVHWQQGLTIAQLRGALEDRLAGMSLRTVLRGMVRTDLITISNPVDTGDPKNQIVQVFSQKVKTLWGEGGNLQENVASLAEIRI